MSNDLLFPILPRNNKVPVEVDERVKKVQRTKKSDRIRDDEQDQFEQLKQVEIAQRTVNRKQDPSADRDTTEGDDGLKHIDIDV
ncbi:hypothetical protein D210916BOD24_09900 [Alteromonas sp. D210916BOD_24]|uniref:hypothetical protein n=1 Tax=Alteromonas sp. D210916BOD_24 TaxID=3157618 RepID=UPI00399CE6C5